MPRRLEGSKEGRRVAQRREPLGGLMHDPRQLELFPSEPTSPQGKGVAQGAAEPMRAAAHGQLGSE
jgi:hypothetical protein